MCSHLQRLFSLELRWAGTFDSAPQSAMQSVQATLAGVANSDVTIVLPIEIEYTVQSAAMMDQDLAKKSLTSFFADENRFIRALNAESVHAGAHAVVQLKQQHRPLSY